MPRLGDKKKKNGRFLSKVFEGEFPVFVLFLIMSFFIWWSLSMNSNFETVVNVPVRLYNVPDEMRVVNDLPPTVSVSLSGKGTSLMKAARVCRRNTLEIDSHHFTKGSQRATFAVWEFRDSLAAFLPQSVMIRNVTPDTLAFEFVRQHKRLLPVVAGGEFTSASQYYAETVSFLPDSVTVYLLDEELAATSISANVDGIEIGTDSIDVTVSLEPVGSSFPAVSEVRMTVRAEQYTEKRLKVPLTAVDFPRGVHLRTFPSTVTVSSWVRMSDFDHVAERDFKIGIDYTTLHEADGGKAEPVLLEKPAGVKNVRVLSGLVEYLLEKD